MDEKKINEMYLENMQLAFDEYKDNGNIEGCRKVIDAVKDAGFQKEANGMIDDLYNAPLSKFIHESSLLWI